MAKTLRSAATSLLQRRKAALVRRLRIPPNALRASYVEQYLTCGKKNCRCWQGHKHGPFHYLVQCLGTGRIQKYLLKSAEQRRHANAAIAAYSEFQKQLEELSQINTELLRRDLNLRSSI